jgi:hypothetical protein
MPGRRSHENLHSCSYDQTSYRGPALIFPTAKPRVLHSFVPLLLEIEMN